MPPTPIKAAILGTGNIGSDLMFKLLREPGRLNLALFAGIDPASEGLARARSLGVSVSDRGIDAVLEARDISIVFDATSAKAHVRHAPALAAAGRVAIDLTPAARGPYVVPSANLRAHLNAPNVNLITCGGQATIPLVYAVSQVTPVAYAEMVSTVASLSAGPGTRQNIDEFTFTTARGLEAIGGAAAAKAIMPGRDPGGAITTMLTGIGGSVIGCGIALFFWRDMSIDPISFKGFFAAVFGAFALLFFYRLLSGSFFNETSDNEDRWVHRLRRRSKRRKVVEDVLRDAA